MVLSTVGPTLCITRLQSQSYEGQNLPVQHIIHSGVQRNRFSTPTFAKPKRRRNSTHKCRPSTPDPSRFLPLFHQERDQHRFRLKSIANADSKPPELPQPRTRLLAAISSHARLRLHLPQPTSTPPTMPALALQPNSSMPQVKQSHSPLRMPAILRKLPFSNLSMIQTTGRSGLG